MTSVHSFLIISVGMRVPFELLLRGCCYGSLLFHILIAQVILQAEGSNYSDESEAITTPDGRVRGIKNITGADFIFGGLFPVRSLESGSIQCGELRKERGIERMEAMLYAIDDINNRTDILNGYTIGYDLRDTCSSQTVGVEEALDILVRGGVLRDIEESSITECIDKVSGNSTYNKLPAGVLGAASSGVSAQVASLLRLFKMTQISYSSSSTELSDAEKYNFFLRTFPADDLQTLAIVDLLENFEWKFVSIIYSLNAYGEAGHREFLIHAKNRNVCIDLDSGILESSGTDNYKQLAENLLKSKAKVVILFCLDFFANRFIEQVNLLQKEMNFTTRFMWIASDGWARSTSIASSEYVDTVAGYIGFLPYTLHHSGFEKYFSGLLPSTNIRNKHLFTSFYDLFCKNVNDSCNNSRLPVTEMKSYRQGSFIPLVIDAVNALASAIQRFLDDHCSGTRKWNRESQVCIGNDSNVTLTSELLLRYLLDNVTFISASGYIVDFLANGDIRAPYRIINFNATENTSITQKFVQIGTWNPTLSNDIRLNLSRSMIQFGFEDGPERILRKEPLESTCSKTCENGFHRHLESGLCCWECIKCVGQTYSDDPNITSCKKCSEGEWGNNPTEGSTGCEALPLRELTPDNLVLIVATVLSFLSLLAVLIIAIILMVHCKHPVVKSSGREQLTLLLIGITLSFMFAFVIIPPVSIPSCFFQRLIIWTSTSLVFGALLVKIVRVARIFLRDVTTARPKYTEPHYQVLFTLVLVGIQLLITLISFVIHSPTPVEELQSSEGSLLAPTRVITCSTINTAIFIVQIVYDAVLILLCTYFGWKTRNFPENFNEAKYVLFTSLALILIWLGFIPSYILSPSEYKFVALSFPVILSSITVLVIFFIPKIYFIYFRKDSGSQPKSLFTSGMDITNFKYLGAASSGSTPLPKQKPERKESATCPEFHDEEAPSVKNVTFTTASNSEKIKGDMWNVALNDQHKEKEVHTE